MSETLESILDQLNQLDQWRMKAAILRDAGKRGLRENNIWYEDSALRRRNPPASGSKILEDATVLRALLCHRRRDAGTQVSESIATLVRTLESQSLPALLTAEDDNLPVLRAARVMSALAAAPDSALTSTAVYCFYAIVRELYTGEAPDWVIGGARAGEGLASCAFVTNECIHALLGFERTLLHTAGFIEAIRENVRRREPPASLQLLEDVSEWLEVDDRRARLDLQITSEVQKENIALPLPSIGDRSVSEFLRVVSAEVQKQVRACAEILTEAVGKIVDHVNEESFDANSIRSRAGHDVAIAILKGVGHRAQTVVASFDLSDAHEITMLAAAAAFFRTTARDVRNILKPAGEYVSRALDRELTAATSEAALWDVGELLFAAISHGHLTYRPGEWDEERLQRAALYAARLVSERGRFPSGQAIHSSPRGYALHVPNVDVIRAFAELLHNVATDVDPAVMKRFMYYVDDTQTSDTETTDALWAPNSELRTGLPWRAVTASTILALDEMNRMLDVRINSRVMRHFAVRKPDEISAPALADIFYPDYGLASLKCDPKVKRDESVAVTLQRMRAHVNGLHLRTEDHPDRLFSLILHGPPGTGKTTLVESLAKTCRVPLVEVTPSDLIAGGVDAIEGTARAVFRALALLTRVVILFDEFDPVLLQRHDDQKEATAFSFLTPGMLPKLKALHDAASRRSVTYILNTNLIGKLDDAAVRGGRFDAKVGIYPPDLLSRAGRLRWALAKYVRDSETAFEVRQQAPLILDVPADFRVRFERVTMSIRLGPMNTLGSPGWFSVPQDLAPKPLRPRKDAFNYIFGERLFEAPEPESEPRISSEKAVARREAEEYIYVDLWDRVAGETQSILTSIERKIQYSEQTLPEALTAPPLPPTEKKLVRTLAGALEERPTYDDVSAVVERMLRERRGVSELGDGLVSPVETMSKEPKRPRRGTARRDGKKQNKMPSTDAEGDS